MRIGLDFGTTNSGAAVFDGRRVHVFALDPASRDPSVVRSTLYITRDHEVFFGQEAIDTYYRQNVGRPSKMVRQYIGEIEMTLADVGSVKGYPVGPATFVRDVYALVDELMPGRLLRSLKSGLATSYEGTTIFGRYYELEELLALYLQEIRERVEAETGQVVDGVVLGRPVSFVGSGAEADNRRAQRRLRCAAAKAGFRDIAFELEPVAAALHYELTAGEPQNVVVFDFGGGTLDITVMRIGEPGLALSEAEGLVLSEAEGPVLSGAEGPVLSGAEGPVLSGAEGPVLSKVKGQRRVFATGGLGIAGDVFDQRIIESLLLHHFGRGSTWGEDAAPFPNQYTDALVNWQTIPELSWPETLYFLRLVQMTSSHPKQIKALESLLVNNYAIRLIDKVERAKIALSAAHFATIWLTGDDIDVWQPITRSQFELLIADAAHRVEACLLDTLERSGLRAEEIDAIVRTGGSAQIPCFIEMMGRIFGPEKVVLLDVFSGVTAGLAICACADQV